MRKLYVDESGHTGEVSYKDMNGQPFFALAGVLTSDRQESDLMHSIQDQKQHHHIQGNKLKAANVYKSKPEFCNNLIDYILMNNIPYLIELMDKQYYLPIHLTECFISPYYSTPNSAARKQIADSLAGLITRFWKDWTLSHSKKIKTYFESIKRLALPTIHHNTGINFFVKQHLAKKFLQSPQGGHS